jgi:NAD+ synthase (glutamine-hydrolysing)
MKIKCHQTHHTIADFDNIFKYLEDNVTNKDEGIHLFPELFLTGYPLQDLCLQKSFIDRYLKSLKTLEKWSKKLSDNTILLMGGLSYNLTKAGLPDSIKNVIFKVTKGLVEPIYTKQLLPNYDIFDEQKYFSAGSESKVLSIGEMKVGLMICEDMWSSSFHGTDPVQNLLDHSKGISLDCIINLSASPYILTKDQKRETRAREISNLFQCPFLYLNKVGAEDEIIFDGASFISDGTSTLTRAKVFEQDILEINLQDLSPQYEKMPSNKVAHTWEDLFESKIVQAKGKKPQIKRWTDDECESVTKALMFGFQEYARKSGFQNFTIALSGGMDSALVLALVRLSLKEGQYLEAVYMPSIHSSPLSHELSLQLVKNLGISLSTLPIKFLHSTAKNLFGQTFPQPFDGLTDENIQSRLRGTLLYTRSNQINSMVVNTSNKSELAVGYSTQYGDSVGAISMLGDVYKSQVYRLAEYLNDKNPELIPEEIITRPPTAELRPDQKDTDSLPPYENLDAILDGILSYRYSKKDLIKAGFDIEEVEQVLTLYRRTEYKRYQFCPILKVSSKSFGFGYRVPISKSSSFYTEE